MRIKDYGIIAFWILRCSNWMIQAAFTAPHTSHKTRGLNYKHTQFIQHDDDDDDDHNYQINISQ